MLQFYGWFALKVSMPVTWLKIINGKEQLWQISPFLLHRKKVMGLKWHDSEFITEFSFLDVVFLKCSFLTMHLRTSWMVSFQDLSAYLDFKSDIKVLVFILAGPMKGTDQQWTTPCFYLRLFWELLLYSLLDKKQKQILNQPKPFVFWSFSLFMGFGNLSAEGQLS